MAFEVVRTADDGAKESFDSAAAAARRSGLVAKTLRKLLQKGGGSLGGFRWEYVDNTSSIQTEEVTEHEHVGPDSEPAEPETEIVEPRAMEPDVYNRDLTPSSTFPSLTAEDGTIIVEMCTDGYINATKICRIAGKEWNHYKDNKSTREYLCELEKSLQSDDCKGVLIRSVVTGPNDLRGTWVHPRIATHLAQWCSVEFGVKVSGWIEDLKSSNPDVAKEYDAAIEDIIGSRGKREVEMHISDDLARELHGLREVRCIHGRIDVLTPDNVIEVKRVEKYARAIGQAIVYASCYPGRLPTIYLFGEQEDYSEVVTRARDAANGAKVAFQYRRIQPTPDKNTSNVASEPAPKKARVEESTSVQLMEHWIDRVNALEEKMDVVMKDPFVRAIGSKNGGEFAGHVFGFPYVVTVTPYSYYNEWCLFVYFRNHKYDLHPLDDKFLTPEIADIPFVEFPGKYCSCTCKRRSLVARKTFPSIVDVGHEGSVLFKKGVDVEDALRSLPSIWKLFGIDMTVPENVVVSRVGYNDVDAFGDIPCAWHPECPHFGVDMAWGSKELNDVCTMYKRVRGDTYTFF